MSDMGYSDDDFSPAIGRLVMENRDLRQIVSARAALAERALLELRGAYRAIVRAEVTMKESRALT